MLIAPLFVARAFAAPDPSIIRNIDLTPTDFDSDIFPVIDTTAGGDPEENIPANLEEAALCGGWDWDDEVGDQVGVGKIAKVEGVPGRHVAGGDPLTQIHLGMAEKDNTFSFPPDTCGLVTACRPTGWGDVATYPFLAQREVEILKFHPCQRPLDGYRIDGPGADPLGKYPDGDPAKNPNANVPADTLFDKGLHYSCGGGTMAAAEGNFCSELDANHADGGICQALNEMKIHIVQQRVWSCEDFGPAGGPADFQWTLIGFDRAKRGRPGAALGTTQRCFNEVYGEYCGNGILDGGETCDKGNPCAGGQKCDYATCTCTPKPAGTINLPASTEADFGVPSGVGCAAGGPSPFEVYEITPGPEGLRYCCTDAASDNVDMPNCKTCQGLDCKGNIRIGTIRHDTWQYRDGGADCRNQAFDCTRNVLDYDSFFRHYIGSYQRDTVDAVPDDDAQRTNIPVSCYRFYSEYDPKEKVSGGSRHSCVISVYYRDGPHADNWFIHGDPSVTDMEQTQEGKGEYGQNQGYPDFDSNSENPGLRIPIRGEFDDVNDLWFQELGTAFSLINGKKLVDEYDNNLTVALLALDTARQKASVPIQKAVSPEWHLSPGALMRATDDTVADINQKRTIIEWWQEQQTAAHTLFTPPVIRLIIPTTWSIGLDPLQEIFNPDIPDPTDPEPMGNPTRLPIVDQLEAREDMVGEVQKYLEQSMLMKVREEHIPVVVPLGSASEYRSLAAQWCGWEKRRLVDPAIDCEAIGGDVGDIISKLHQYAKRIDDVRKLRAQLPDTAAAYLNLYTSVQSEIGKWILDNADALQAFQAERDTRLQIKEQWQFIEREWHRAHDRDGLPWCRNDRFTLPIYSLLDKWMDRDGSLVADSNSLDGDNLPRLMATPMNDLVLDFSTIHLPEEQLLIPILDPIQIRIDPDMVSAPSPEADTPPDIDLPDLPNIDNLLFKNIISGGVPLPTPGTVTNRPKSLTDFKPDITEDPTVQDTLDDIEDMVSGMRSAYAKFWNSLAKDPFELCGTDFCIPDGAEEDCYGPNRDTCVHVEMDLVERFTRMGARPGVQLLEDFTSVGDHRKILEEGYRDCAPSDWACQFLNGEDRAAKQGWTIQTPPPNDLKATIDTLRRREFEESLWRPGVPVDDNFPYVTNRNDIVPSFNIPPDTSLSP